MSIKVAERVWKLSRHRRAPKLLLIALAEYANDNGVCWPGVNQLAERIGEKERQTRYLLRALEDDGSIIRMYRPGRGHTTIYAITIGMTEQEREIKKGALKHLYCEEKGAETSPYSENKGAEKCPLPEEKGAFSRHKGGIFTSTENEPIEAPESDKTAQNFSDNRHDPSCIHDLEGGNHDNVDHPPPQKNIQLLDSLIGVCNLTTALLTGKQLEEFNQVYQQLNNAGVTAEQLDKFPSWWQNATLNWLAREAAQRKRRLDPPRPRQVLEFWPQFSAQPPSRASPIVAAPPSPIAVDAMDAAGIARYLKTNGVVHDDTARTTKQRRS